MSCGNRGFLLVALGVSLLVTGSGEPDPIRVGFIGGLSGRSADIGQASRNAVQMAVEEKNSAGGIDGRMIELIVKDDGGDPQVAARAATELVAAKVEAIIGPNLSGIAAGMVPVINEAKILTIAPTVSSLVFSGKDDHFFRIASTTRQNAISYAEHRYAQGLRRVAAAVDDSNRIFSQSWMEEFRAAFEGMGGEVVAASMFDANAEAGYATTVSELLANDPDALMFVANGVDTAQLAQQVRKLDSEVVLIGAEWAASESLIELGGRAIEGLELLQSYDRTDQSPSYRRFLDAYRDHFHEDPGFSGVAAYDASTALFAAMSHRKEGQALKDALLALGPVPGLQQDIVFDRFGEGQRRAFFVVVRNGQFVSG